MVIDKYVQRGWPRYKGIALEAGSEVSYSVSGVYGKNGIGSNLNLFFL